jgi:hypothetical protein
MRDLRRAAGVAVIAAVVSGCAARPVSQLKVGECFDFSGETNEVTSVAVVECTSPHAAEAFEVFDVALDAFDATAIAAAADERCLGAFEGYVGYPYNAADFYYRALTPGADGWANGARTVVCLVVPQEGTLTGSVKKSDV